MGKSKSGFLYPKTDFAFLYLNPKMDQSGISDLTNPHSEWIHQIKSISGFLGFMIGAFLWGTDPKIVHLSSGLPCKFTALAIFLSIFRDKTFDREKENSGDYSIPYI